MKLYEINEQIERLTDQITFDEETGEILCDIDAITAEMNALQMEKKSVLEYLAKLVLNLRAEAAAIKAEEIRLRERRTRLGKKEDRLMAILDRECNGEKTDLGVATVSYRKTNRMEITDSGEALFWLREFGYTDCYKTPAPEISKSEVKKLVKSGVEVPGCELVEDYSCSLR